ncbi:MAG TPA: lipoyl(octanoyl) transferase LipB [Nitrososphaerales archaeon]|nr:lipoyl(octanoyl) transferase LipB [Nitrososphaerales archaeon]
MDKSGSENGGDTVMSPNFRLLDLGFSKDYGSVLDIQRKILADRIDRNEPDVLILVEHDHVVTLGRSSHLENILLTGLPSYSIERGGDVTYHGPGQLVCYPIISLQEKGLGVRQYVEHLETAIVRTLDQIGIKNAEGKLGRETGVWIDGRRKIASIGVAVSHWVTYHGLALNVNTDLSYFQRIRPCGFDANIMTSVSKELGVNRFEMGVVKQSMMKHLGEEFGWVETT